MTLWTEDDVEILAEAIWTAAGYDLNGDPESSTAREWRPEFMKQARAGLEAVAPLIAARALEPLDDIAIELEHRANVFAGQTGNVESAYRNAVEFIRFHLDLYTEVIEDVEEEPRKFVAMSKDVGHYHEAHQYVTLVLHEDGHVTWEDFKYE